MKPAPRFYLAATGLRLYDASVSNMTTRCIRCRCRETKSMARSNTPVRQRGRAADHCVRPSAFTCFLPRDSVARNLAVWRVHQGFNNRKFLQLNPTGTLRNFESGVYGGSTRHDDQGREIT